MQEGHIHPISSLIREANQIFYAMGFTCAEGPLLESEHYNFDMLNFPKDHPARDMQDTFFVKDRPGYVLRTHTSPVQVRYMEAQMKKGTMPPYRVIVPGKVFRNEATDMTHEAEFFQIEGLAVGEDITLAHLKGTLAKFLEEIMSASARGGPASGGKGNQGSASGGKATNVEIRFRPSFFPFVEPGVEVDMRVTGKDAPAKTSPGTGSSPLSVSPGEPKALADASLSDAFREKFRDKWIEMMGAGMVHPNVLKNAGVDPAKYQGFAFGMGLDRLALLRWGIDDIRLMHSADLRFVNQF